MRIQDCDEDDISGSLLPRERRILEEAIEKEKESVPEKLSFSRLLPLLPGDEVYMVNGFDGVFVRKINKKQNGFGWTAEGPSGIVTAGGSKLKAARHLIAMEQLQGKLSQFPEWNNNK